MDDEDLDRSRPFGTRTGGFRSWTTRRWVAAGTTVALVLLLALVLCGSWIFARSTAINNHLVESSSPALIASVRLESALIDQETGVRGFAMTGRPEFLEPYRTGQIRQRAAERQLRELGAGNPETLRDLAEVRRLAERWRSRVAEPAASSVSDPARIQEQAEAGKALFDPLRTALTAQQSHLENQRASARADLLGARALRNWTFAAIALVILALAGSVVVALRRGITDHLDRLSTDVRTVAAGDFDHPVAGSGPADLRALAADVEAMRARLAAELLHRDAATAELASQAAELSRSNAELEQFAYVASHDLQEPLRKVASFCQLLERRYSAQLDDRARQYIDFAVDGANRMQGLISDLLAFSRVGRLLTDHSAVDLEDVFDRTLYALSQSIEETGALVTHDPLPTVGGDRTQLGMLFQNLITNAVKFRAPERVPRIHLRARQTDGTWEFAVEDNGIGIAPEFADRIFVVFQRLHTRERYSGNGIGLALCKKIVEYHGGTIALDPGHTPGARFVFTLPGDSRAVSAESP
ncbi:CHASE3 domain-containing protein [Streptomyces sp. NBC_01498]|uniref:sensor histidine kinase n=1 Tax=Streptomyces sp. NBC_01498 TaxID=2975870 RepID=UPI002E7BEBB9|nr:ATP-binding protein [Streptomyces sp. NBC_01498]WTL24531.1 CHASE3 domain-containing protein [Streptomyces sp. NBC_01498]